jgi:hypothetical protein
VTDVLHVAGHGEVNNALLTVGAVAGTGFHLFSFDGPVASSLHSVNHATSTGYSVTVNGLNFGYSEFTLTVRLDSTACGTSSWIGSTSIKCHLISGGISTMLHTAVTLSSLIATGKALYSFDAPVSSFLLESNLPTSTKQWITVSGLNFGIADHTASAILQNSVTSVSWTSTTTLVAYAGSHAAMASYVGMPNPQDLLLTVSAIAGTTSDVFTFDAPLSSAWLRPNLPASTTYSLTVHGLNFGMDQYTTSVQLGLTACSTVSWTTTTQVRCYFNVKGMKMLDDADISSSVTVSAVAGTQLSAFSFDSAVSSLINPYNLVNSGASTVTVTGLNFGFSDFSATMQLMQTTCQTTAWSSASSVKCVTDAGHGGTVAASITLNAVVGTSSTIFSFDGPVFSFIHQVNVPTTSGASVTVTGLNFGSEALTPTTSFASTLCSTVAWSSGTAVQCHTVEGIGTAVTGMVTVTTVAGTKLHLFTYDAALISITTVGANIAASGGGGGLGSLVSLVGLNFGVLDYSATGNFNAGSCITTSWTSDSSVFCDAAFGSGPANSVMLTVSGVAGTQAYVFSFDTPLLSHAALNAPMSGSASVTVTGLNFGLYDYTDSARLASRTCSTASWSSKSSITCKSGVSDEPFPTVAITVSALAGTHISLFTFDVPVASVAHMNAPNTGGASVTVGGLNFGHHAFTQTIALGEGPCWSSSWISTSSARCQTGPAYADPWLMQATVGAVVGTATYVSYTFDAPAISGVHTNAPHSGGASITVAGLNFGTFEFTTSISLEMAICLTTSWSSSSSVDCIGSIGIHFPGYVTLTVSAVAGTGASMFSFDAPVLSMAVPNSPSTGGNSVTIAGLGFGPYGFTATLGIGEATCASTAWTTATLVACNPVPRYSGYPGYTEVTVAGTVGTGAEGTWTFDAPVASAALVNAPLTGPGSITVVGLNFGGYGEHTSTAGLYGAGCHTTTWSSASSLTCSGTKESDHYLYPGFMEVTVAANTGTGAGLLSFDAPLISSVVSYNAPLSGGVFISLNGLNFLNADFTSSAALSSAVCATTAWVSTTMLICDSMPTKDYPGYTQLTVAAVSGTSFGAFTYDAPFMSFPMLNVANTGGTSVTVVGLNFAFSDFTATASIGTEICSTTAWSSSSTLSCVTEAIERGDASTRITLTSVVGTGVASFTFDAPVLSAHLQNAILTGASSVTVSGLSFGVPEMTSTAAFSAVPCETSSWTSVTSLSCQQDIPGQEQRYLDSSALPVATVAGMVGTTSPGLFTFDAPFFSYVYLNAPATGQASLTLVGLGFQIADDTVTAAFSAIACATSTWTTASSVRCRSGGVAISDYLQATVAGVVGTSVGVFTFDAPLLSRTLGNAPFSGNTGSVTILGLNFDMGLDDATATASLSLAACATTTWTSTSSLLCRTVELRGYPGYAQLTVGAAVGTGVSVFSFDTAVISAAIGNSPSSGGASVTVHGLHFGQNSYTVTSRVAGDMMITTSWSTSTSVLGQTYGVASWQNVNEYGQFDPGYALLTVDAFVGTGNRVLSFDAPVVSQINANAPHSGETSLTMIGLNFGLVSWSPTIQLGDVSCSTSTWTSLSAVRCFTSEYATYPSFAAVTVAAVAGTANNLLSFDAPVTSSVHMNGPLSGGADLTVYGLGFGNADWTLTQGLSSQGCSTASWITTTMLFCVSTSLANYPGYVDTTIAAVVGTGASIFSFDAPVTSHVALNTPHCGVASVTVTGLNFGYVMHSATVHLAEIACSTAAWSSRTSVTCTVGDMHSTSRTVEVTVASVVATVTNVFTFDAPVLSQWVQNAPFSGAADLTVHGFNFGLAYLTPSLAIASAPCGTTSWQSSTAVHCFNLPSMAQYPGYSEMTLASVIGTGDRLFSFDVPVTSLVSPNLPHSASASVTVAGLNFGTSNYTATFHASGGAICATTTWFSTTAVQCDVSPTPVFRVPYVSYESYPGYTSLTVAAIVGTGAHVHSFDAPVLSGVYINAPQTGGDISVTVLGLNFGTVNVSSTAALHELPCSCSGWTSSTQVTCQPLHPTNANHIGYPGYAQLTLATVIGTADGLFSFDVPILSGISPNMPMSGDMTVSVQGLNFGAADYTSSASVGVVPCSTLSWTSTTSFTCVPFDKSAHYLSKSPGFAELTIAAVIGTGVNVLSFDAAVFSSSFLNGPISAGAELTLKGVHFGFDSQTATMALHTAACTTTSWSTSTSVYCLSAPGVGYPGFVQVTVDALVGTGWGIGTGARVFSFDAPVTSSIWLNSPDTGGGYLTISGISFGMVNMTATQLLGQASVGTASWTSATSVHMLPLMPGINDTSADFTYPGYVHHTVAVMVSTGVNVYTFDAPIMSMATLNTPLTGEMSITVSGLNFGSSEYTVTSAMSTAPCATTSWQASTLMVCQVAHYDELALYGVGYPGYVALTVAAIAGTAGYIDGYPAFSFDSPILSRSIFNLPLSGSATATLHGVNFGYNNFTATATVAADTCETTSWSTLTSLRCVGSALHSLGWAERSAFMTLASAIGTWQEGWSFDAPVLSRADMNSPLSGGASVTVSGLSFGVDDFSASIAAGGQPCSTAAWSSTTSISCLTSDLGWYPVHLMGTISSFIGTGARAVFTFDTPVASAIMPNAPNTGGLVVTVSGLNFGVVSYTTSVAVASRDCYTTSWSAATLLSCMIDGDWAQSGPTHGYPGFVMLTMSSLVSTTQGILSFDSPAISFVYPNTPHTGGATITLSGSDFGPADHTPTVALSSADCHTSTWQSSTLVQCVGAAMASDPQYAELTIAEVVGTILPGLLSFDAPVATSVRLNGPLSGSASLTLFGMNFGATDLTATAAFAQGDCFTTTWTSATFLGCISSMAVAHPWYDQITVTNSVGTSKQVFTYDAPMTSILLGNLVLTGSSSVTVSGLHFGPVDFTSTVAIASAACATVSWSSASSLSCTVPDLPDAETPDMRQKVIPISPVRDSAVTLAQSVGSAMFQFTFDAPIGSHAYFNSPASGHKSVTVLGLSFGGMDPTPTLALGAAPCFTATWTTQTWMRCFNRGFVDSPQALQPTVAAVVGTALNLFSFDAPVASAALPKYQDIATNIPLSGGTSLTVGGFNFGEYSDMSLTVTLGTVACFTSSWTSQTSVECLTDDVGEYPGVAIVTVASIVGTGLEVFSFDAPALSYLTRNTPATGGASITMSGMSIGLRDFTVTASLTSAECTTSSWTSSSTLLCLGSELTRSDRVATITLADTIGTFVQPYGSGEFMYSFDAPVTSSMIPPNAAVTGRFSVTVLGVNFHAFDGTPSAMFDVTAVGRDYKPCQTVSWSTDTSVACFFNEDPGYHLTMGVYTTVGELVSTQALVFSYDAPVISFMHPNNAPAVASTVISVMGINMALSDMTPSMRLGANDGFGSCLTSSWTSGTTVVCQNGYGEGTMRSALTISNILGTQTYDLFTYEGCGTGFGKTVTCAPTGAPTAVPTVTPTLDPTELPTLHPTIVPTLQPTLHPTRLPTQLPTSTPTLLPTLDPSAVPTLAPTDVAALDTTFPTLVPTSLAPFTLPPTIQPSVAPTGTPTLEPTVASTLHPTETPTEFPSSIPSLEPTEVPTLTPTEQFQPATETGTPSVAPTEVPTEVPSEAPTEHPTLEPTAVPTLSPTFDPSVSPTVTPTTPTPTASPSPAPTLAPTIGDPGTAYMILDTTVDSLTSDALVEIQDALAALLGVTSADITVTLFTGSAIVQVSIAGGAIDGAGLAQKLASDYQAGTLAELSTNSATYTVLGVSTTQGEYTYVPTPLPSGAPSPIPTPVPTHEPSHTPTTPTPTLNPTVDPTRVPTEQPTLEPTPIPTVEPTEVPSLLPTAEPTPPPTRDPTCEGCTPPPSPAPTITPTPMPSIEPTVNPTFDPTSIPSPAPSFDPTAIPTPIPSLEPTSTPTPVPSPLPSPAPTPSPSPMPSPGPTSTPSAGPTHIPSPSPTLATPSPTPIPSPAPSPSPSPSPTPVPSYVPSPTPTVEPTPSPTPSPTPMPTSTPTDGPTAVPTPVPTPSPSPSPTPEPTVPGYTYPPTQIPTTPTPTINPTRDPTLFPTAKPSLSPSFAPTGSPTTTPSLTPTSRWAYNEGQSTLLPTMPPTFVPTQLPTSPPTFVPSVMPSISPTLAPTAPGDLDTRQPSLNPTEFPTFAPSALPTEVTPVPSHGPTTPVPSIAPSTPVPTSYQPTYVPSGTPSGIPSTAAPTYVQINSTVVFVADVAADTNIEALTSSIADNVAANLGIDSDRVIVTYDYESTDGSIRRQTQNVEFSITIIGDDEGLGERVSEEIKADGAERPVLAQTILPPEIDFVPGENIKPVIYITLAPTQSPTAPAEIGFFIAGDVSSEIGREPYNITLYGGQYATIFITKLQPNGEADSGVSVIVTRGEARSGRVSTSGSAVTYIAPDTLLSEDLITLDVNLAGYPPRQVEIGVILLFRNSPPIAADDIGVTDEDVPIAIAVLTNDADPERNEMFIYDVLLQPVHGVTQHNRTHIVYTPDRGYYGADYMTYLVADGLEPYRGSQPLPQARVNLVIRPVHRLSVYQDGTIDVYALPHASEATQAPIVMTNVQQQPTLGTLSIGALGSWARYRANGQSGEDRFSLLVSGAPYATVLVQMTVVAAPQTGSRTCLNGCSVHGSCNTQLGACECQAGWFSYSCNELLFRVSRPVNNVTELGSVSTFSIRLLAPPTAPVTCALTSSDATEGRVPSSLVLSDSNWQGVIVNVSGVADDVADSDQRFRVRIGPCTSTDGRFSNVDPSGFAEIGEVVIYNKDVRFPVILSVQPELTSHETQVVVNGRDFQYGCTVEIDGVSVSKYPSDRRKQDTSCIFIGSNWQCGIYQFTWLAATTSAGGNEQQTLQFKMPPYNASGYKNVVITNPGGGTSSRLTGELFYTDQCAEVGKHLLKGSCADCPVGASCPGGNRVWPNDGYSNKGEFSGFVQECTRPEQRSTLEQRCIGGRNPRCGRGYGGLFCADCADGYYTEESGWGCYECGSNGGYADQLIRAGWIFVLILNLILPLLSPFFLSNLLSMLVCALSVIGAAGPMGFASLTSSLHDAYSGVSIVTLDTRTMRLGCEGAGTDFSSEIFWTNIGALLLLPVPTLVVLGALSGSISMLHRFNLVGVSMQSMVPLLADRAMAIIGVWLEMAYFALLRVAFEATACMSVDSELRLAVQLSQQCFEGSHMPVFMVAIVLMLALLIGWPLWSTVHLATMRRDGRIMQEQAINRFGYLFRSFREDRLHRRLGWLLVRVGLATQGAVAHWPVARMLCILVPAALCLVADTFRPPRRKMSANIVNAIALLFVAIAAVLHYLLVSDMDLNLAARDAYATLVIAMVCGIVILHLMMAFEFIIEFCEKEGAIGLLSVWFIDNLVWPRDSQSFWKRDVVSPVQDEDGDEAPEPQSRRSNRVAPEPPSDEAAGRRMPALDPVVAQKLHDSQIADLQETDLDSGEIRPLPTVIQSRQSTPSTVEMSLSDGGRDPEPFDPLPGQVANGVPQPSLSVYGPTMDIHSDGHVPLLEEIPEVEGDEPPLFDQEAPYPQLPDMSPRASEGSPRVPPMQQRGWMTPPQSYRDRDWSDDEPVEAGLDDDIRPSSHPTPPARYTPQQSLAASGEILETVAQADGLSGELHLTHGDEFEPFQQGVSAPGWDQQPRSPAHTALYSRQGEFTGLIPVPPASLSQGRMPRSIQAPARDESNDLVNEELRAMLFRQQSGDNRR